MISTPCDLLWFADGRKSDAPQVWVAGCSYANGTGVSKQERYGQLVANNLNREASFLSILGSSIPWAADQILRADMRKNDIVLWGLTDISRYVTFKNNIFVNVFPHTFVIDCKPIELAKVEGESRQHVMDYYGYYQQGVATWTEKDRTELESNLVNSDRLMQAVQSIHQVANFCNKIDAKLVLFMHDFSLPEFSNFVKPQISNLENFLDISTEVDKDKIGTGHPGIITHQNWSDEILKFMKEKNYV